MISATTGVLDDEKKDDEATHTTSTPWHFATRIAFRFCFAYFGLFCLTFAQITFAYTGMLGSWFSDRAVMWQMVALDPVTRWVGQTVFGVEAALDPDSGSGDQAAIWSLIFCLLVVAVGATVIWSVFDRRRTSYPRLEAWFLVFLRLCLGGQMLFYGFGEGDPDPDAGTPASGVAPPVRRLEPTGGAVAAGRQLTSL